MKLRLFGLALVIAVAAATLFATTLTAPTADLAEAWPWQDPNVKVGWNPCQVQVKSATLTVKWTNNNRTYSRSYSGEIHNKSIWACKGAYVLFKSVHTGTATITLKGQRPGLINCSTPYSGTKSGVKIFRPLVGTTLTNIVVQMSPTGSCR